MFPTTSDPPSPGATFGETLQRLRLQAGMSKYQLARESSLPHSAIFRYETGQRGVPGPETVRALADALCLHIGLDAVQLIDAAVYEIERQYRGEQGITRTGALARLYERYESRTPIGANT